VRAGTVLLRAGARIGPGEIGLLASQNIARVQVYRRPKVALLSTGDELRALGAPLEPGAIVNSNIYVLTDMLHRLGAIPVALPAARDTLPEIESALRTALEADVVITMGGVSVGAYDFVQGAFKNVGIEPRFWKVRIKPGKRLAFAQYAGKPIVGLPGNPIGAMVTFEILVAPCPRKMLGDPQPHPQPVLARLRDAYTRRPGRVEIARGSRPATETRSSSPCTHSKARALCPRLRVSMPLSSFLPMRPSSAPASRWRRSSGVQD